jgi:hypothetical protein
MTRLPDPMLRRAAGFIWLTGRVLDQRRLAHFTGAREATAWSPRSTPTTGSEAHPGKTIEAPQILRAWDE